MDYPLLAFGLSVVSGSIYFIIRLYKTKEKGLRS